MESMLGVATFLLPLMLKSPQPPSSAKKITTFGRAAAACKRGLESEVRRASSTPANNEPVRPTRVRSKGGIGMGKKNVQGIRNDKGERLSGNSMKAIAGELERSGARFSASRTRG